MVKFSAIKPLRDRARENGVSISTFKKWMRESWFPQSELRQVGGFCGQPRLGLTDRGQELIQTVLAARAEQALAQPRAIPTNLANPKTAAAKSIAVRRAKSAAKAAARDAEQTSVS